MSPARRIVAWLPLLVCVAAAQQGTTPKPKSEDYPAGIRSGDLFLAAEYLVHTIMSGKQSFVVPDYLVIEVAVYPGKGKSEKLSSEQFRLRINGKHIVTADAPGMVAASVHYTDWEPKRKLSTEVGVGPVIIGRDPQREPRFPGDPGGRRKPLPDAGVQQPESDPNRLSEDEAIQQWAFPTGEWRQPVSGFVYFRFTGKPKSIKSLELLFQREGQEATVRLIP